MATFPQSLLSSEIEVVSALTKQPRQRVDVFMRGGGRVQIIRHPASFQAHPEFYRNVLQPLPIAGSVRRAAASMLLMQGDFFVERELVFAAAANGTKISLFRYKEWESASVYESHLQQLIQDDHPEIVVSVNMLGFDGNGLLAEHAARAGIPVLIWFVDDPRPILLNHRNAITRDMRIFTWERSYIPWLRQQGFSSVGYLPLAADVHRSADTLAGDGSIRCGFIGTSMGRRFLDEIAAKFIWRPEFAALAMRVAEQLLHQPGINIDRFIDEAQMRNSGESSFDAPTRTWLCSYCIHLASMLKRRGTINRMQGAGVETFGDPDGWRELCGGWLTTHADLDYRTGIAAGYRSIAVNLNITSCQMPTGLNQRVFDVPMSGAFVLNDHQADIETLFAPDEYATYRSVDELAEKEEFYCRNSNARKAIIIAARRHIFADHTYKHRLRTLLQSV
jgi:spore maturation protein CgeB